MLSPSLHREEYLKKKRNRRLLKYGLSIFLFVGVVALASYISHRPQIRIRQVEFSGGVLVTGEEVSAETLAYLSGSYLWLFPRNNALWYPRKSLGQDLKDKFQRIDTIDARLKDFHTLVITVTERKPVAMWCDGVEIKLEPSATDRDGGSTEANTPSATDRDGGSTEANTPKCYLDRKSVV